MKIIHVIPGFLPEKLAGTEIYCWSLCKNLQAEGHDTEVVIPGYGQKETTAYEYDGIRVTRYAEPTVQTRLHISGLALPEGIANYKAYIRQAKPDIVHFHAIYGGVGLTVQHIVETKALGFKVVYTMHLPKHVCANNTMVHKGKELCDGIIRPVRCAACTLVHQNKSELVADTIATVSGALRTIGIDTGKWDNPAGTALSSVNRIVAIKKDLGRLAAATDMVVLYARWFQKIIIANGFPAAQTEYVPPALSWSGETGRPSKPLDFKNPDGVKLIFVGRIDPEKGVHLLIEAIKGLPEDKIELSLYGKPIEEDYYERCRKMSAGCSNIHWRGLLAREEILSTFARHDMLCLPSAFSEMSPLVIQEAFGAGIPVLASEVYGNAELIRHDNNGLLFPFKSLDGLQQQLRRLIGEKGLLPRLKQGVTPPLTFDEIAKKYLRIYSSLQYTKTGALI
jgi:glycosyltransferase involved in cell wall biosynthesis